MLATSQPLGGGSGPWLLLPGPDGLWAFEPSSDALILAEDRHALAPMDITAMVPRQGGRLAYTTGENGIDNLTLNLLSLSGGDELHLPLVLPEYYPGPEDLPGDPAVEAVRALFEVTSLAWSPDGAALAFIGMLSGPSADLYVLYPAENALLRLSDEDGQAFQPAWSPDGQHVVFAVAETFGTGAGYSMAGVWVARADGSELRLLYDTAGSSGESFVGWLDEVTLLVHSWSPVCGNERLRAVALADGAETALWPGPFNGVALNRETGSLLVSLDTYTANCPEAVSQGLYFLPGIGEAAIRLTADEAFLPVWDAAYGFFVSRTPTDVLAVDPAGNVFKLQGPEPSLPAANRQGDFAWAGPASGVWVARLDGAARRIFDQPAFTPVWAQDGTTLFFLAEQGLFRAAAPDFSPELAAPGTFSGGAAWVAP